MRISVDAHAIGQHLTGNEVYVRNLLAAYPSLDREAVFLAYTSAPDTHPAIRALPSAIHLRPVARNPVLRLGYDLGRQLRRDRPDMLHVQYTAPLACPVPIVATVHDVSFVEHPEFFSKARCAQLRWSVAKTVRSAAKVIAPSEFSRRAILRTYGCPESKVVTVPNGVSGAFRPISQEIAKAHVARRYGYSFPFLLMVGDLQRRKNQLGLMRAFEELLRLHPALPHHLVFVGQDSWQSARIKHAAARSAVSERIHFAGWVDDDDVLWFYNAAEVFVFPSLYEGFGLPVLEAMACGTAVACSDRTAIFEVADSCAVTFDPGSTASMVRALRDVLLDAELRTRMSRLGQQRVSKFTWEQAARKTLDVYRSVAGNARPVTAVSRASVTP